MYDFIYTSVYTSIYNFAFGASSVGSITSLISPAASLR